MIRIIISLQLLRKRNQMRVIMSKMNLTPASYWLGPVALFSIFLLNGCAGSSTEIRYDETTKTYSSPSGGIKTTIGRYDNTTANYVIAKGEGTKTFSSPQSGLKSTVGRYDNVTAHYTLRQGRASAPQSEAIKTSLGTSEKQIADLPMVLEVTDVLFEFDKWVIKEPFLPELDKWVDYFQNNPLVTAEFYGHADSTGPIMYNQKLSEKRAQAVINYLVAKGVASNRLTAKGFGESQPTAPNNTKEGRQKNRRVEVNF